MIFKEKTLLSETINMRRLEMRMPHAAKGIGALVVGEDENDVGTR
jgi:hypothetical protein